jgi:hypothetical protein
MIAAGFSEDDLSTVYLCKNKQLYFRFVSAGVVEDDAERHAITAPDDADAVPHPGPVIAARTGPRPFAHREYCARAARKIQDDRPRLHSRPLFDQHELTAREVAIRIAEHQHGLHRKMKIAVQVLM